MNIQKLNYNWYIVSFSHWEFDTLAVKDLLKYFAKQPPQLCSQLGNQYNYKVNKSIMNRVEDVQYAPFTKAEYLKGEEEFYEFMEQFEDDAI